MGRPIMINHLLSLSLSLTHFDSVLIYAKQENEEYFHPLHLVPPTLVGLAMAVSDSTAFHPSMSHQKLIRHVHFRLDRFKTSTNWTPKTFVTFTSDA
jgi:hypothetical protein